MFRGSKIQYRCGTTVEREFKNEHKSFGRHATLSRMRVVSVEYQICNFDRFARPPAPGDEFGL
jgi:hypothetical protein